MTTVNLYDSCQSIYDSCQKLFNKQNVKNKRILTVALYFWQSLKYCEAENFFLVIKVLPNNNICPADIHPPAV